MIRIATVWVGLSIEGTMYRAQLEPDPFIKRVENPNLNPLLTVGSGWVGRSCVQLVSFGPVQDRLTS